MDIRSVKYLFFGCVVAAVASTTGCISPEKEKEKQKKTADFEVYDREKMADILFDLTLVESAYRLNMADADAMNKRDPVFRAILARHQTDTLTFDQNWLYYGGEPEDMAKVYALVTEKIDKERGARGAKPVETQPVQQP